MRFYDDYRIVELDTEVVACEPQAEGYWIATAQSCFFVESGGMASDQGWINTQPVLAVKQIDGQVWHLLSETISGPVKLQVDFEHRLRMVQAHTAQHLISALVFELTSGVTTNLHVSTNGNTIRFENLTVKLDLKILQAKVNHAIMADLPVTITYPRDDDYRVVSIGDLDHNPCGCLHVQSLKELGLVQLLMITESKNQVTVTYLAGLSMIDYWQPRYDILQQLTKITAKDHLSLTETVSNWQEQLIKSSKLIETMRREQLIEKIKKLHPSERLAIKVNDLAIDQGSWLVQQVIALVSEVAVIYTLIDHRVYFWFGGTAAEQWFRRLQQQWNLKGGGKGLSYNGSGEWSPDMEYLLTQELTTEIYTIE